VSPYKQLIVCKYWLLIAKVDCTLRRISYFDATKSPESALEMDSMLQWLSWTIQPLRDLYSHKLEIFEAILQSSLPSVHRILRPNVKHDTTCSRPHLHLFPISTLHPPVIPSLLLPPSSSSYPHSPHSPHFHPHPSSSPPSHPANPPARSVSSPPSLVPNP